MKNVLPITLCMLAIIIAFKGIKVDRSVTVKLYCEDLIPIPNATVPTTPRITIPARSL